MDALDAIRSARAALAVAVMRERVVARRIAARLPMFQAQVGHRFDFRADAFADFGWAVPKKPGPKTTASKLAGVLKGQATRKARGTMGRKEKLKIRGTVT